LARLQHTYPAFESAVGEDVHRLDTDRLVVAEVRAGYGCSQLAASAKPGFAGCLRDIPAVADALATGVIRLEHARLLDRETAALGVGSAVVEELLAGNASALETTGCGWTLRQWTGRAVLEADPSRGRAGRRGHPGRAAGLARRGHRARRRQLRVGRPGRGQLDHVIAFPNGPTNVTNFAPQCPPDHNGKTHGGWVHALDPQSGR
jgi:hypothetical protein